jgi:cell wall-associated NlpC family hydrolase
MIPAWANRYIGVPYKDYGFDLDGWHCWGLVRYILLHERKIELPKYGEVSAVELLRVARLLKSEPEGGQTWIEVHGPRSPFDVLLMRGRGEMSRSAVHCGIMVSPTVVMHVHKGISTAAVPITNRTIAFCMVRTYRHRELV